MLIPLGEATQTSEYISILVLNILDADFGPGREEEGKRRQHSIRAQSQRSPGNAQPIFNSLMEVLVGINFTFMQFSSLNYYIVLKTLMSFQKRDQSSTTQRRDCPK